MAICFLSLAISLAEVLALTAEGATLSRIQVHPIYDNAVAIYVRTNLNNQGPSINTSLVASIAQTNRDPLFSYGADDLRGEFAGRA